MRRTTWTVAVFFFARWPTTRRRPHWCWSCCWANQKLLLRRRLARAAARRGPPPRRLVPKFKLIAVAHIVRKMVNNEKCCYSQIDSSSFWSCPSPSKSGQQRNNLSLNPLSFRWSHLTVNKETTTSENWLSLQSRTITGTCCSRQLAASRGVTSVATTSV